MSKSLLYVSCPEDVRVNFGKIVKLYQYSYQKFSNYCDFISALKANEIETDIVILYIDKKISHEVQHDLDSLKANLDKLAIILVYNSSKLTPSDEICNTVDYELDASELPSNSLIEKTLARGARLALVRKAHGQSTIKAKEQYRIESFIGRSSLAQEVRNMLHKLINVPISSIFIIGETGTGKGLVARILHTQSSCQSGPLIEVNCSAIPAELMESELFGHEAGAFTGAKKAHKGYLEQADGGTLFLDEITEMDMDLQSKLLKAIEDKTIRRVGGENEIQVSITIIAASNKDITKAVEDKTLREDLYHRLSVFCFELPPLRKRKEDLLDLVPEIINEYNYKSGNKKVSTVKDATWKKLMDCEWPGNIRELRNIIERCVLFSDNEVFDDRWMGNECNDISSQTDNSLSNELMLSDIIEEEQQQQDTVQSIEEEGGSTTICKFPIDGSKSLSDMEKEIIKTGLEKKDGNVTETARLLSISREKLRYRINKYKLNK